MQKISTMRTKGNRTSKGQLTIGLDLGDRSSSLDAAGEITLEQKLPTTPEGIKQTLAKCRGVAWRWKLERILPG